MADANSIALAQASTQAPTQATSQAPTQVQAAEQAPVAPAAPVAPEAPAASGATGEAAGQSLTPELPAQAGDADAAAAGGDPGGLLISDPSAAGPSAADPSALDPSAAAEPSAWVQGPVGDMLGRDVSHAVDGGFQTAWGYLDNGGPAIWAIAFLAVLTLALILWKTWRFFLAGAWSRRRSRTALRALEAGRPDAALDLLTGRLGLRSQVLRAAIAARETMPEPAAREDTARIAQNALASARSGLRPLELIATIAPLLGLLGTVLGMIAAFRTLQEAGGRADPAMLAGGIWEALLTTAAGMAVAIPASASLAWFESVLDRVRLDMEDAMTRVFLAPRVATPAQSLADPARPETAHAA